jgi:hypothetical protein
MVSIWAWEGIGDNLIGQVLREWPPYLRVRIWLTPGTQSGRPTPTQRDQLLHTGISSHILVHRGAGPLLPGGSARPTKKRHLTTCTQRGWPTHTQRARPTTILRCRPPSTQRGQPCPRQRGRPARTQRSLPTSTQLRCPFIHRGVSPVSPFLHRGIGPFLQGGVDPFLHRMVGSPIHRVVSPLLHGRISQLLHSSRREVGPLVQSPSFPPGAHGEESPVSPIPLPVLRWLRTSPSTRWRNCSTRSPLPFPAHDDCQPLLKGQSHEIFRALLWQSSID